MAKVNVEVAFDQPERAYHPGDFVTGSVFLHAGRDLDGLGVKATTGWQTHGSGSTDRGPTIELINEPGVGVVAGQARALPFSFACPEKPYTYRGHRIKIDHYVEVKVAVPFGRDPKEREEFFVSPALRTANASSTALEPRAMSALPTDTEPVDRDSVRRVLTTRPGAAMWFLPVFLMLAVSFVFGLFFGTALMIAITAAWIHFRPQVFGRIFTDLAIESADTQVHPAGQWPIRLQFNVTHGFKMTGMRVRLVGIEVAVDDSGTTSSTKRHTFHDVVQRFHGPRSFTNGDRFDETCVVDVPDSIAWSFEAEHNTVTWEAELVLEIEGFPDWVHRTRLNLQPHSSASARVIDPATTSDRFVAELDPPRVTPTVQDTIESANAEAVPIPEKLTPTPPTRAQPAAPVPAIPAVAPPPMDGGADRPRSELTGLLTELAAMSDSVSDQEDHVRARSGETFGVAVIVDRVVRSMRSSLGEDHRRGREIVGVLTDRDDEVQIFLLESSSDGVASVRRGDRFECVVHPHGWDGLYKRLVLIEAAK